jgi:putative transposase
MKPGVFTQMYVQLVLAVKNRAALLKDPSQREEVYKYISGTVSGLKNKSIIVNGVSDHVHIFVGLHPTCSVSNLVADIKKHSSVFINEKQWFIGKFAWQEGFGAFSYSKGAIDSVYKYIANQQVHHSKRSFREEYLALLDEFEIEYEQRFLFDFHG